MKNLLYTIILFATVFPGYNIGDTISEEDQMYPHEVCHSDGNYNIDSTFRFSDYSGDLILISMNATW